jgi:hypothetical protein
MADDLSTTLANLEELRQQAMSQMKKWGGGALVLGIVLAVVLYLAGSDNGALIAGGGGLVASGVICMVLWSKVKGEFKQKIMPVLLAGIDPSLRYDMNHGISAAEFKLPGLFKTPDRFSGKDLVTGKIGETAVRFSFVDAEEEYQETVRDSDGDSHSETRTRSIFSGLFFIADFNKHFGGKTRIEPHGAGLLDKLFGSHVELEDPVFNKEFAVTSTDQVEARYILTPSLMERFKALRDKVGKFKIAFVNEHMFLAIEMKSDAFDPDISHSFAESGQVEKILGKLKTVTGIVEDLGLNTRIWTKV